MTVLVCNDVGIAYKKIRPWKKSAKEWVLRSVTLSIKQGETLGVVGRNGAGKSSLLRVMAGISEPDEGEIKVYARSVSLLALGVGFLPHLSGKENIVHSLMLMGMRLDEANRMVASVLQFADLGGFSDQPIGVYSAGMRARLAFSIAYHVDAELLLVDEVIAVGDQAFQKKCRLHMRKKVSEGRAAVIVSHNLSMLGTWCDRVAWLGDGHLKMIGESKEVISAYKRSLR